MIKSFIDLLQRIYFFIMVKYIIALFVFSTNLVLAQQQETDLIIPYRMDDLWGYADTSRKIIIPAVYDSVDFISSNDKGYVYKNGKMGLINTKGKLLIPIIYDKIWENYFGYEVTKGTKIGLFNKKGSKVLNVEWDDISSTYPNQRVIVKRGNFYGAFWENSKTSKIEQIIPIKYKELWQPNSYSFNGKGKDGNDLSFDSLGHNLDKNEILIYNKNNNENQVEDIASCSDNFRIKKPLNSNNKCIIYRDIYKDGDCYSKLTFIDTLKESYDIINSDFVLSQILIVKRGTNWGVISLSNHSIVPLMYDSIKAKFCLENLIFIVKKNEHWGIISKEGKIILEPVYDSIDEKSKVLIIKSDNKIGLFNGNFLIEPKYLKYNSYEYNYDHKYYVYKVIRNDNRLIYIDQLGNEYSK